ncbi:MAG: AI-2E family transporter [Acetivibrionales bacterium]|jgi:predicted PurR-regulated permease PerM
MALRRRVILYIILSLLMAGCTLFIYIYREKIGRVLTPFFIAVAVAYLFKPLVARLETKRIPPKYGILIVYFAFAVLLVGIMLFIIPELIESTKELINTIPEMTVTYQGIFDGILSEVQSSNWSPDIKNIIYNEIKNCTVIVQNYIVDILRKTLAAVINTATIFFDLVLSMVIAYYFIKDGEYFKNLIMPLVPKKKRNGFISIGRKINGVLSSFIQGQLMTAAIVGVMETIGLSIVGVKYSLILGLIGGIAEIIPYFGPIIGGIPAVAIALVESPVKALWTLLVFVIVQQLENSFISPKIIESKLGLHPVTTIFAVLIGGQFMGILGMLLAVPVTAVLKVLAHSLIEAIV